MYENGIAMVSRHTSVVCQKRVKVGGIGFSDIAASDTYCCHLYWQIISSFVQI